MLAVSLRSWVSMETRRFNREEHLMKTILKGMIVVVGIGLVASAIAHRKVIMACVKGEPMPEAPEWHKKCGIHKD